MLLKIVCYLIDAMFMLMKLQIALTKTINTIIFCDYLMGMDRTRTPLLRIRTRNLFSSSVTLDEIATAAEDEMT